MRAEYDQSTLVFALVRKLCEAILELSQTSEQADKLKTLRVMAEVTIAEIARIEAAP